MFTPRRKQEALKPPPRVTPGDQQWVAIMKKAFDRSIESYFTSTSEPGEFPFTTTEEGNTRRKKKSLRQFRGLTQVCRIIRNEFLPLYQKRTTYRICHLDMQEYLHTVLLKECQEVARQAVEAMYDPNTDHIGQQQYLDVWHKKESTHRSRIHRKFIIDCKSLEQKLKTVSSRPWSSSHDSTVDILPFIAFIATAPNIHTQCGHNTCPCCMHDWSGMKVLLNMLFTPHQHVKLWTWVKGSVEEITLQWPPHVHFHIKKGHGKAWMKDWNENMAFHGAEAEEWVKEVGFSFEKEWWPGSVCFVLHQGDLEGGNEEKGEMSDEDRLFWEQVNGRKRGRMGGGSWKPRYCGKAKLERVGRGKGRWR
jgi:hypothetical protein